MHGHVQGQPGPIHEQRGERGPHSATALPPGIFRSGVHLPDAPRGPPERPRELPHLRHGAGAVDRDVGRRRRGSRAAGHVAEVLVRAGLHRAALRHLDGRYAARLTRLGAAQSPLEGGVGAGAGHPRRAVVGLAVLCACRRLGPKSQPQHVHAHRPGSERRLPLQPDRGGGARHLSAFLPGAWRGRGLLRSVRRDRDVDPAGAGARAEGTQPNGSGDQVPARAGPHDRPAPERGRERGGCPARPGPGGRPAPRTPRGEDPRRWRRRRGAERGRRGNGHR